MTMYTALAGDTITKIAAAFHFDDFRDIFEHPDNADLREARPDPNLLVAGDQVHIPDRPEPTTHQLPTDQNHQVVVPVLRQVVRVQFHPHAEGPYDGLEYELEAGTERFEGVIGGIIEHQVSAKLHTVTLTVHGVGESAETVRWTLALGHLDPIEMMTGCQARLRNMGFDCGPVDGLDGPKTRAAVRAFQRHAGVGDDGVIGPVTRGKLTEAYGC